MLAAKPPQLVAAPSLSQMQIADLSRLVISSRVSSASFPRVWRAAYSSGGVYSGTRVLSSSTAASPPRSTSAINDEGEQGRCWSTGGVLVGVFMSVLGCRFAGFGGAYRRPSRARAYSFSGPERRLAFRAFMRSLLRLRSAFEKAFGFPFPAAPMMDAALIFIPQCGHFMGCSRECR